MALQSNRVQGDQHETQLQHQRKIPTEPKASVLGQSSLKHGELEKTVLATATEFPVMGQADRCVEVVTQCHFWQIQAKYYRASSSKRNCSKIINKINRKPQSRLFLQPNEKPWFNLYLTWKKAQQQTGNCHQSFVHSAHQQLIWKTDMAKFSVKRKDAAA